MDTDIFFKRAKFDMCVSDETFEKDAVRTLNQYLYLPKYKNQMIFLAELEKGLQTRDKDKTYETCLALLGKTIKLAATVPPPMEDKMLFLVETLIDVLYVHNERTIATLMKKITAIEDVSSTVIVFCHKKLINHLLEDDRDDPEYILYVQKQILKDRAYLVVITELFAKYMIARKMTYVVPNWQKLIKSDVGQTKAHFFFTITRAIQEASLHGRSAGRTECQ